MGDLHSGDLMATAVANRVITGQTLAVVVVIMEWAGALTVVAEAEAPMLVTIKALLQSSMARLLDGCHLLQVLQVSAAALLRLREPLALVWVFPLLHQHTMELDALMMGTGVVIRHIKEAIEMVVPSHLQAGIMVLLLRVERMALTVADVITVK